MLRPFALRSAALAVAVLTLLPGPAAADIASALPEAAVLDIALGREHSCALTPSRRVFCWGYGLYGQIGDGANTNRSLPTEVTALGAGVLAIAAGGHTTCAINAGGRLFCWGRGNRGQIGDGDSVDRWTPTAVEGLGDDIQAVAVGGEHVCALNRLRRVYCWGRGDNGQLGDASLADRSLPVLVQGLAAGTRAIATGGYHSCALDADGEAFCWGWNARGQLGDGSTDDRTSRVAVQGLGANLRQLDLGVDFSCAVTAAGRMSCWGGGGQGQIGNGDTANQPTPVRVRRLGTGIHGISAGGGYDYGGHACALDAAGRAFCWGRNDEGQVGDRSQTDRSLRRRVSRFGEDMRLIAAGGFHSCAVNGLGRAYCWGYNTRGQLGDGTNTTRAAPAPVSGNLHRQ
ncbi:MAG: hypothetical protein KJZ85_00290 [Rhodobacteraceae bacterium]|jgi:alpha-tubulin suppressor-like RCC1 family protein|nr:hypothetical protein [Paracoccaceae bacterium]